MALNATLEAMGTATAAQECIFEVPRSKPPEELRAYAYLRLREEGLLENLLWERWPPMGVREFLEWTDRIVMLGCYLRRPTSDTDPTLAGFGIVGKVQEIGEYRKLEIGMAFFREFQRRHIAERFTEELLDYCFIDAEADFIYGVSPLHNRAAIRFGQRLGLQQTIIPGFAWWRGQSADAMYSWMSKGDWRARRAHDAI